MTYEYVCTACEHEWEASQPISAAPLKTCPKCQQEAARRQVSGGTGFVLKGGGWYSDLYSSPSANKKKADGEATKAESGDASNKPAAGASSESKAGASSESKGSGSESSSTANA